MKNRIVYSLLGLILAFSVSAQDLSDAQRADIEERIKPVGEVCLEGDNNCGAPAVAAAGAAARSGEDVYNTSCMACHSTGAAGAPKLGDAAAWADRIAQGNDALYANALGGIAGTGMMAKGGCMNCSDDETKAAVDYMVAGSQ